MNTHPEQMEVEVISTSKHERLTTIVVVAARNRYEAVERADDINFILWQGGRQEEVKAVTLDGFYRLIEDTHKRSLYEDPCANTACNIVGLTYGFHFGTGDDLNALTSFAGLVYDGDMLSLAQIWDRVVESPAATPVNMCELWREIVH